MGKTKNHRERGQGCRVGVARSEYEIPPNKTSPLQSGEQVHYHGVICLIIVNNGRKNKVTVKCPCSTTVFLARKHKPQFHRCQRAGRTLPFRHSYFDELPRGVQCFHLPTSCCSRSRASPDFRMSL